MQNVMALQRPQQAGTHCGRGASWGGLLGAMLAAIAAVFPGRALACGFTDLECYLDTTQYSLIYGLATFLWELNRALLMLVHQLEALRVWVAGRAFTSAYDTLAGLIGPLLTPAATIAVLLGCLLFLALPLLGRVQLINIRHALVWAALAPLLLAQAGTLLVHVEQFRADIGSRIVAAAQPVAGDAGLFRPGAGDMAAPQALYPSGGCGARITRPRLLPEQPPATSDLHMDDLAAALLYADATDIHCPQRNQPRPELPHRFYDKSGPDYATAEDPGTMISPVDRQHYVEQIQKGVNRLGLGLIPSALAIVEALIQLLFALALVIVWAALPLALLLVFFQQDMGVVMTLVRRATSVVLTSWVVSFVLGLLFACLTAAASAGNAAGYTGFAIGGLLLTLWLLAVAVDTFMDSLSTLSGVISAGTGTRLEQPYHTASRWGRAGAGASAALTTGGAAAVGGVVGAAAGAVASYAHTGDNGYVLGAVSGRIRPIAAVGEVAAGMGLLSETTELGLVAG
jgi:hypothetical protein